MKPLPMARPAHVDPVCGMTVDPPRAAGQSTVGERTIYFCSLGCKRRFDADPSAFLQGSRPQPLAASHGLHAAAPASAARADPGPSDGVFTCPMHPEVRQTG